MSQSQNPFADPPARDFNPYASPAPAPILLGGQVENAVWRKDNLLVMHKQAKLPAFCVKTNAPAEEWLKRKLAWYSPWLLLLILISILVFAIVALIVQKKAEIMIGLTRKQLSIHRQRKMITGIVVGLGILLLVVGVVAANLHQPGDSEAYIAFFPLALFTFLGGLIYGLIACRIVSPKKIDDNFVWLKGVHPDYLQRLPEWPGA